MSATTSIEQLWGSNVARQEGACSCCTPLCDVRARHSLLFGVINLAPAEVLEPLAPQLAHNARTVVVPGLGESMAVPDARLVPAHHIQPESVEGRMNNVADRLAGLAQELERPGDMLPAAGLTTRDRCAQ